MLLGALALHVGAPAADAEAWVDELERLIDHDELTVEYCESLDDEPRHTARRWIRCTAGRNETLIALEALDLPDGTYSLGAADHVHI